MTINISSAIGVQQKIPFASINLQSGLTSFTYKILLNGVSVSTTATFSEIGNGLYVMVFTPVSTGVYVLFVQGEIAASVTIGPKDLYTSLANIEDQALGSWKWDKVKGTMTMYKVNGTVLATFIVKDNLTVASRSRQS